MISPRKCFIVTIYIVILFAELQSIRGGAAAFMNECTKIEINEMASSMLRSRKPFHTPDGWIVQDINAPTEVVWDRILDYDHYKEMDPDTMESEIYKREVIEDGRMENIFVRMAAGRPFFKLAFFVQAQHIPEKNSLIWTLDRTQKSEIQDSYGCWHVIPHPDEPSTKSRVFFYHKLTLYSWIPSVLKNAINRSTVTGATRWLQRQCEGKARNVS